MDSDAEVLDYRQKQVQAAEASKPKDITSEGVENISTESQNTTDEDRPI